CEGHEDEAGKACQLELENGDEHLHREDEKGEDHDHPRDQQHDDRQEVVEEGREAEILVDLLQQRPGGGEAGPGKAAGLQKIGSGDRPTACGQSGLRERAEDDVAER
ncbi:hypothetical protein LTR94_033462, partial [Friedmanniomyces endolithicus]